MLMNHDIPCRMSHSSHPKDIDCPLETACPILCDRHLDSIGQHTSHKAKSTMSIVVTTTNEPCNHVNTLTCSNTAKHTPEQVASQAGPTDLS